MPRDETKAFYCDPPLVGQYITINVQGRREIVTVCEAEVYTSEFASTCQYI